MTKTIIPPTPGPWHVNGYNLTQVIKVEDGPDRAGRAYVDGRHQEVIADVGRDNEMTWGERHANARLLAASPRLIAFAERVRGLCARQANLLSTATDEDRKRFVREVYTLWNTDGIDAVAQATGEEA